MPDYNDTTAKYVIIETQTAGDGTVSNLVNVIEGRNNAASEFHRVLMYAAISELPCHAATWLNADGSLVDWKAYYHEVPTES